MMVNSVGFDVILWADIWCLELTQFTQLSQYTQQYHISAFCSSLTADVNCFYSCHKLLILSNVWESTMEWQMKNLLFKQNLKSFIKQVHDA